MADPVLAIDNLQMAIDREAVLRGVGLRIQAGEVHGLVGESGAGKSMIGRAILGVLPPRARVLGGSIRFEGRDLLRMPPRDYRRLLGREIALIPQDPMMALNPGRSIGRQMIDFLHIRLGLSRTDSRRRAAELLASVSIRAPEKVLNQYPHQLSGGMRQRVLIGMAFAGRPRLIIADEPTTALDVTVQRTVLDVLNTLQAEHGCAIVFITHDLGLVAKLCDAVTVLHGGRVLEHGATAEIIAAPEHPYTRALLAATPRFDRPEQVLEPIPTALIDRLWAEARQWDARAGLAA